MFKHTVAIVALVSLSACLLSPQDMALLQGDYEASYRASCAQMPGNIYCVHYAKWQHDNPDASFEDYTEFYAANSTATGHATGQFRQELGDLQERQYDLYDACIRSNRQAPGVCWDAFLSQR